MSPEETQTQHLRATNLKALIWDLGGIAHEYATVDQLDHIVDNILFHGFPTKTTKRLLRWIHVHRKDPKFKIHNILGDGMSQLKSVIPDCFARFHDPSAPECRICLDQVKCAKRCKEAQKDDAPTPPERVKQVYAISEKAPADEITTVLLHKAGQISKTLCRGHKVVLVIDGNALRVLTTEDPISTEANMAGKPSTKSKKHEEEEDDEDETPVAPVKKKSAKPVVDEDEEEETEDTEDEAADEEEEETPAPKKKAKKVAVTEDEDEEDEAPAKPAKKEKKAKKEKAPLNKKQQAFKDALGKQKDTEARQAYSKKIAKEMKLKIAEKDDERINHMVRVMAISKALA